MNETDMQTEGFSKNKRTHVFARLKVSALTKYVHRSNLANMHLWDRLLRSLNFRPLIQPLSRNDALAFTLAEVLITLGIIGVVAAMTIPHLVNNTNDAELKTAYKKYYSAFSNAGASIVQEYSSMNDGINNQTDSIRDDKIHSVLCSKLICGKRCLHNNGAGMCWHDGTHYKQLQGLDGVLDFNSYTSTILNTGAMFVAYSASGTCGLTLGSAPLNEVCGYIYLDVNGFRTPNTLGRDIFGFYITQTGIVPIGIVAGTTYSDMSNYCNRSGGNNTWDGVSCGPKILSGENY